MFVSDLKQNSDFSKPLYYFSHILFFNMQSKGIRNPCPPQNPNYSGFLNIHKKIHNVSRLLDTKMNKIVY